jgi:hypothetical protein
VKKLVLSGTKLEAVKALLSIVAEHRDEFRQLINDGDKIYNFGELGKVLNACTGVTAALMSELEKLGKVDTLDAYIGEPGKRIAALVKGVDGDA